MFTERFNELLDSVLQLTTTEFAVMSGYDRSYLTHLRNGDRIPRPGYGAVKRLARTICDCAGKTGRTQRLCERIGISPLADADDISAAVEAWLLEGEPIPVRKNAAKERARSNKRLMYPFGKRLNAAMELADMSNQGLARALNVDSSLIRKWRSGLRVPRVGHPMIHEIGVILGSRIFSLGRIAALSQLVDAQRMEALTEAEGIALLDKWLHDFSEADTTLIESFLDDLDQFSPDTPLPLLPPEEAVGDAMDELVGTYQGICGLRRAVLRFLYTACRDERPQLLLYSDQNMDWMTADRAYAARWMSLMGAYLGTGGKIQIIHNVDRGLAEMIAAIRSWLPLYVSGGVESWYSVKRGGERFSYTIFLEPENACISTYYPAGRERNARYRYDTAAPELAYQHQLYEDMLADSKPLIAIERASMRPQSSPIRRDRETHRIGNTLSLETMPEELLKRILDRTDLPEKTRRDVTSDWAAAAELLAEQLRDGVIHDCVPLPDREALLAGQVAVDTELAGIYYRPEEYAEHMRHILALVEEKAGFRFYPLSEAPFQRIKIIASAHMAMLGYVAKRPITFTTSHPLLCRAFVNFAVRLEEQYDYELQELIEQMKAYHIDV